MTSVYYDVVISGGGIAGCACAYIAAKSGLKTLLIEQESYLGGQITGGLVVPMMKIGEKKINTEFYDSLILNAKKFGAQINYLDKNDGWLNPELLKIVLDDMLVDVNCKILFDAKILKVSHQENIFSGEISSKTLSIPFETKYLIDATGDGALAELLNCAFWQDNEQKQPNSLRFMMSNVDIEALCEYLGEIDDDKDVTNFAKIDTEMHFTTAYTWDSDKKWALEPLFKTAIKEGILRLEDTDYFQMFSVAKMHNTVAFNCPRLKESKEGCFSYSDSIIEGRRAIYRLSNFCKRYLKGFENACISNIADIIGVREFRRVKCRYDFKIDDILEPKTFDNPVLYSDYPIDIHSNNRDGSTLKKIQTYSLPLESLISRDYDNLFIIGKSLGADFKAQASLRVQASCMSMGEGVARHIISLNK